MKEFPMHDYIAIIWFLFNYRSGEDWKRARSASNNQIKPSNVQTYTSEVSNIMAKFVDYIQSARDGDGRINDIVTPIKRLIMSCKDI